MSDKERRKKLPIGIENFEEICSQGFYYVDKTGLIRDLLHAWGKVNLFTRPRRFGKSLNMSMLRYFFETGCNKALFEGLEIMEESDLCEEYMGQFPVIAVSLKGISASDYKTARSLMCAAVGSEAMRFYCLLDSDRITSEEKEIYKQLITADASGQSVYAMSDAALMGSLKTLSVLLHKHYGKKVMILIDEYDVPLAKADENGYYDEMILLMRNIFEQALKSNDSLYFAVLTGCLRVSQESIFTGLNNTNVFSVTDEECDSYFGFTDAEVRKMLLYYGLDDKYELIREWYDGYCFGDAQIYCPWDVVSYVSRLRVKKTLAPKDYWSNTSSNDAVKKFLKLAKADTRKEIECLIVGEYVTKEINENLTYKDLYHNIENIWSLLFASGYLTKRGVLENGCMQLAIPNREIHNIFMMQIREWMQIKAREDCFKLEKFCEAFIYADAQTVQTIFTEYLDNTVSIRDTAVRKDLKENFYHGFLLGLLRSREDWTVVSNRESGNGYADIIIENVPEKKGIVVEVKYPDDGSLEHGCQEALKQIGETGYAKQLYLDGMVQVTACGIACYVKNCKAVFQNLS